MSLRRSNLLVLDQDDQRTSSSRLDYNILDQDGRATILETQVQKNKTHLNKTIK